MYLSGISFYVLADQFIIHQNHLYEETMRKNEVSHCTGSEALLVNLCRESTIGKFMPTSRKKFASGIKPVNSGSLKKNF